MIVTAAFSTPLRRLAARIVAAGAILCGLADAVPSFGQTATGSNTKVVEVGGAGVDVESAKRDACREAVRQVVGAYVASKTRTEHDELIEDKVISVSGGLVEKIETLKESSTDGLVRVRIRATVRTTKLLDTLRENKIAVAAVDGQSLGAQLQTKKDQLKGQAELIEAAIEGCPMKWFKASVVGQPRLGDKVDGPNVPMLVTIKIEPDLDAFVASAEKLDKALAATNQGTAEFQCDGAVFGTTHRPEQVGDVVVTALSCLDLEKLLDPLRHLHGVSTQDNPLQVMFPVKFLGKGRRSTWKYYRVRSDDRAAQLLMTLNRGLPWRVALCDTADQEITIKTGTLARYDARGSSWQAGIGKSNYLSGVSGGCVIAPALVFRDGEDMAPMFSFDVLFPLDQEEVSTVRMATVALQ